MKLFLTVLLGLFVLAGILLISSGGLYGNHVAFPLICTAGLCASLVLAILCLEPATLQEKGRPLLAVSLFGCSVVVVLLLPNTGFLIATALFVFLSGPVLFRQKMKSALLSLGSFWIFALGVYHYIMGLPLPGDLLP